MKAAVISVSRAGIRQAEKLAGLFEGADIYVPPRLLSEPGRAAGEVAEPDAEPGDAFKKGCEEDCHQGPAQSGLTTASQEGNYHGKKPLPGENRGEDKFRRARGVALRPLERGLYSGVAEIFRSYPALIFISAAAVAVRAIAPCLEGKDRDPAVVVVDEGGRFAISLLSGHLGGGNELTEKIAALLGAQAVITTATDARGLPAFDDLARKWGWAIENLSDLKHISAALLEGREVILYSRQAPGDAVQGERSPVGSLEEILAGEPAGNIWITEKPEELSRARHGAVIIDNRLEKWPVPGGVPRIILRPKNVAVGVGCRKGVPAEEIIRAVEHAFREAGLSLESLNCLASGEFKAAEEGLIEAARSLGVPLKIFRQKEIAAALKEEALEGTRRSSFVEEQVGVGAVAEPCAVLASGRRQTALPSKRGNGIIVALAEGPVFAAGNT